MTQNRSPEECRLMVVDDDPAMLSLLDAFLQEFYIVDSVQSGPEALEQLTRQSYDLVISDINMPGMKGYELLSKIRQKYPQIKTALITAWSLEDVIHHVLEHNIGNIIAKTVPFNFEELKTTIEKILSGDIFGLERHMQPEAWMSQKLLRQSEEIGEVRGQIMDDIIEEHFDEHRRMLIRLMLDESISNAAYHAHGLPKGTPFDLPEEHAVVLVYGKDSEKIGISVSDQMGKLTQQDILVRLADCFHPTEESLLRESGRGLFLMHSMVDRLIINIKRGYRTEVVLLMYTDKRESGHHPLLIHEI